MNWSNIDKSCESVPFLHCDTPTGNVRLWWSKNAGTYGHQVYGFITDTAGENYSQTNNVGSVFYKTNGCGYSKDCAALEALFTEIGYKPVGMSLGSETIPYKYLIGGNYYRIPADCWEPI